MIVKKTVVAASPTIVSQRKHSTLGSSTTTTSSFISAISKPKGSINDNFCKNCSSSFGPSTNACQVFLSSPNTTTYLVASIFKLNESINYDVSKQFSPISDLSNNANQSLLIVSSDLTPKEVSVLIVESIAIGLRKYHIVHILLYV